MNLLQMEVSKMTIEEISDTCGPQIIPNIEPQTIDGKL